jgi:hypothetical protein
MTAAGWFRFGSYGLVALAVIHFISNHHGLPIRVDDAAGRELLRLMAEYEIDFFGVDRTLDATINGFIISWGIMLLAVAAINFTAIAGRGGIDAPPALSGVNALAWALCLLSALFFWSWPQVLFFAGIAGCFVLALWPRGARGSQPPSRSTRPDPRIAIVGAGPAGLAAAWALKKNGYTNVTVFESADHVGGRCLTLQMDGHYIDITAHEMLAGYTDVMRIAADVGAASHGRQAVLVYDRERRVFLDLLQAGTAGGYTQLQVAWASVRYTWLLLTRYRGIATPGTGLAEAPVELLQPVGTWLRQMRLDALQEVVTFVMEVQGYGRLDEVAAVYFVKFQGLRNWVSNVLHIIGIVHGWPRVFTDGFENLWKSVAKLLNVRLNTNIVSIRRVAKADAEEIGVQITVDDEKTAEEFDALLLACPLDLPTLGKLGIDLGDQESKLFERIRYRTFVTSACRVEGLPTGVVGSIPLPSLLDYTGYIKIYPDSNVAVFFSLSPTPDPDFDDIYRRIVDIVAKLPQTGPQPPRVIERVLQKSWPYFAHPPLTELGGGYFRRLQALQGHRQTFYLGALLEMETVGNTVANALHLVDTQFPART